MFFVLCTHFCPFLTTKLLDIFHTSLALSSQIATLQSCHFMKIATVSHFMLVLINSILKIKKERIFGLSAVFHTIHSIYVENFE